MSREIVIVSARRSAFGRYLGSLSSMEPLDLAVQVARDALERSGTGGRVDQVFAGNCFPASFRAASVTGRQIGLALGLDGFATTVDTACCAPLTALRMASWGMRLGELQTALVVGVESMSRVPHLGRGLREGVRAGPADLVDPIFPISYPGTNPVAVDAADGAERYGVPRRMLDAFAMGSHLKWKDARDAGRFDDEIVGLRVKRRRKQYLFDTDEQPRPHGSVARISMLPTVFGSRTTTAGNAPGLNDGAAAMVVATRERAERDGLPVLGTIVEQVGVTDVPTGISWIPAHAIRKVLERAGRSLEEMDLVEINEAFAAMPLVSTRILAGRDEDRWHALLARTNVNGGAVAIGHPVGVSGLRVAMTMTYELRRRGGGRGVAAICGGLTQGEGIVIEAPAAEGRSAR
jgi:acetyl-CoA C-acetyltransferase